jgi:hypothetical protein
MKEGNQMVFGAHETKVAFCCMVVYGDRAVA